MNRNVQAVVEVAKGRKSGNPYHYWFGVSCHRLCRLTEERCSFVCVCATTLLLNNRCFEIFDYMDEIDKCSSAIIL
jgi:uncharacterized ParB-like nuclease family protein